MKFKNQKGFTIVETLLVILIVAVIGSGSYYVWHSQHKVASGAAKTPAQSQTKSSTQTDSPSLSTGLNDGNYLYIQQYGFKIPLSDGIRDLGYIYQASGGENDAPLVILGSKDLAKDYENEDPTDCTPAFYDKAEGMQSISYIYDQPLSTGAAADETVAIHGKVFYWYLTNAGSGCDFSPSFGLNAAAKSYYQLVFNAFADSQPL